MGQAAQQYLLDLGHRNAQGREDFMIAPSNQDAVAWLDLWPEWPAPVLTIYGPAACGKSHLTAVWKDMAGAGKITLEDLDTYNADDLSSRGQHFYMDDADLAIGDVQREKTLFHLYNILKEGGRSFLLTMTQAPVHRAFSIPDLASRLRAAPAVAIREPDDQLLAAVMVKLFNDRQLRVGPDVISYILPRMERSFEAVRSIVEKADAAALENHKKLSVHLLAQIMNEDSEI